MVKGIERRLSGRWIKLGLGALLVLGLLALGNCRLIRGAGPGDRLDDASAGRDWAGYGRSNGQQHFSPLTHISQRNIAKLGLSWAALRRAYPQLSLIEIVGAPGARAGASAPRDGASRPRRRERPAQ